MSKWIKCIDELPEIGIYWVCDGEEPPKLKLGIEVDIKEHTSPQHVARKVKSAIALSRWRE